MSRAPVRWLVTTLVVGGSLVPQAALRDAETGGAVADAALVMPLPYLALAPLCGTLDALTLLSVRQHVALLLSVAMSYAVYRVVTAGGGGGQSGPRAAACRDGERHAVARAARWGARPHAATVVGEAWRAAAALGGLVAVYAVAVLVPRPMATLALGNPALVAVDFHSHTDASWDGRRGFDAERNRAWHQAGGFGAVYVTDHTCFRGARDGLRGNPPVARDGTVLLGGMEARYQGNHVVVLGAAHGAAVAQHGGEVTAAALPRVGARPLLIVTVPGDLDRLAAGADSTVLRASGVELSDAAPRGFDFVHDHRARLLALADSLDLALVAGSDHHGWGRTVAAWSLVSVPGWRGMAPSALATAIERELRTKRRRAVRVVERHRPRSAGRALAFTAPAVVWTIAATLSWPERMSWLAWVWGSGCIPVLIRRRGPRRATPGEGRGPGGARRSGVACAGLCLTLGARPADGAPGARRAGAADPAVDPGVQPWAAAGAARDSAALALAGAYTLDAEASADVNRAIDDVVRAMHFVARPVARRRLHAANPVYARFTLALSPSEVRLQFDRQPPMVTPRSGAPVRWTRARGEVYVVTTHAAEGRLVQRFVGTEGRRENVYSLSPDGCTITVQVTVSSPRLPRPLAYTLVYRRADHLLAPATSTSRRAVRGPRAYDGAAVASTRGQRRDGAFDFHRAPPGVARDAVQREPAGGRARPCPAQRLDSTVLAGRRHSCRRATAESRPWPT